MIIFLTIMLILVVINAAIMFASMQKANSHRKNSTAIASDLSKQTIYPIDLLTQELKKAV